MPQRMKTELLEAVAHIITIHCYWIRVVAISEHHPYSILRDGHIRTVTCRHLTLEATHSRRHHYVGHRWQIAECDLDLALSDMLRCTPKLHQRCDQFALTPEDVETLIKRASYGIIELDMIEDDYTPPIFRNQKH